jgi:Na+/glutamate symporter
VVLNKKHFKAVLFANLILSKIINTIDLKISQIIQKDLNQSSKVSLKLALTFILMPI